MKYAHLADLHLGSWREEKMRELSTKSFLQAMNDCIINRVDFILFSGDIFNTSLPPIDTLKLVTEKLREFQIKNIPVYVIAGSHDFSPSGKTMIEVLEKAGLVINVCKGQINPETKELELQFTVDPKTGTKITGILGRRGLLDKTYYENLSRDSLEQEPGYKIFMFHTTVTELVPKHLEMMESQPASFFPKGFNYYAGGHIHHPTVKDIPGMGLMTYPGALFPNNFAEMEQYGNGGYYLITLENSQQTIENSQQTIQWKPIEIKSRLALVLDGDHLSPQQIESELIKESSAKKIDDSIITIRLKGKLNAGKVSEIPFNEIIKQLYARGAYFIMKNTNKLYSEEFREIKVANSNPEVMEEQIIREHAQQIKLFSLERELFLTKSLLSSLNIHRKEGESVADFQKKIETETKRVLNLDG